ncbi:MAG: hypothetical protein COA44_01795 [Arcobacter sp.]|nr:MAG: hypothetical protein COA44_01795 [Arcobacter sp.]
MTRSIDEIYNSISQMLIKGIDGSFCDAVLEVELHSLALKISGGYLQVDGSEANSFSSIKEHKKILMNDLIELQAKTKENWNTLNYNLHSNGEFNVEFGFNEGLAEDIQRVCTQV